MSINNSVALTISDETIGSEVARLQNDSKSQNISKKLSVISKYKPISTKAHFNSRSSDSGKSSSCSPILLDCSFDSGIAGLLSDDNDMQLHKRIQQCQCILLALERDQEYFLKIRNRLSKITNRAQKSANENELFCNVCCTEIEANDGKTYGQCHVCKKYICRNIKCADWLPKSGQWECELCQSSKDSLAQTSSWVADQITFNQEKIISPPRARSEIFIPISEYNDSLIHFESVSQTGIHSNTITAEQKIKIREYVEEVVAKLLGGNLDTVSVLQLSNSENYLPASNVKPIHNTTPAEEAPVKTNGHDLSNLSETRLRQMIEKIIAETISCSSMANGRDGAATPRGVSAGANANRKLANGGFNQRHRTERYFEPKIYQDLLATAVLNKIVDGQLKNIQNSAAGETEAGDNDINENENINIEKLSTSSGSSVEPRSDCSYPEVEPIFNNNNEKLSELLRNSDRDSVMSDYLANHMIPLPELNAITTESEEDDYTSVTSSAVGEETWEKNWLFKKKKSGLSGSVTTSSISMLVPDPKEDVRAQIGDKTADEVSDLSELGSDSDDSLNSLRSHLEPINDRLINKHLIGGQNSKMVLDELIERSSMISNTLPHDADPVYTDACNAHLIEANATNEAVNDNVNQQQQKQRTANEQNFDFDMNSNSLTGSIAEREYKKWYNAVEMPNNPYAPEALRRRISGSQERFIDLPNISPTKDLNPLNMLNEPTTAGDNVTLENDYKRYSRDYYINSSLTAPQASPAKDSSAHIAKENREVNNNYNNVNVNRNQSHRNYSRNAKRAHLSNDCHWTLSTPVRRSSSLKYLNKNINPLSPSHLNDPSCHQTSTIIHQTRPSTTISFYNHFSTPNNDGTEDEADDTDSHSQISSKSSLTSKLKLRTASSLSLFSIDSSRSSNMSRSKQKDNTIFTQFEKQLLHKDLKRNSFRAASATTKDFVLNPLYEKDQFFKVDENPNL